MGFSVLHPRKGVRYYLHSALAPKGREHYIYWFSKEEADSIDMPDGFELTWNTKTKQPIVRRIRRFS